MTVSPLATVREALESLREERQARSPLAPTGDVDEALAVLDSLDGTITLSREEAERMRETINVLVTFLPLFSGDKGRAARASAAVERADAERALLAARIEEAK